MSIESLKESLLAELKSLQDTLCIKRRIQLDLEDLELLGDGWLVRLSVDSEEESMSLDAIRRQVELALREELSAPTLQTAIRRRQKCQTY